MLILPLHHRVDVRHLPWMSLLIALLCVLVHLGPQQGDAGRLARAEQLYAMAGLEAIEAPLYQRFAESHPEALVNAFSTDPDTHPPALVMQADRAFRRALESGAAFDDLDAHAAWTKRSSAFRHAIASMVDERYAMPSDAPTLWQGLSSAFLHGDLGHLLGNLLFLLMLGLLVERALGAWVFLGLYLLSGVAAAWTWALTYAGPPTILVGASGAIAGLMGALCVLWGMRRIRFFYWFVVVFDYVRAPAILLLPAWLGWEVVQWATDEEGTVAYQAHAGGIVAGALLALVAKALHWDRPSAYEETVAAADGPDEALSRARAALGRLDLAGVDRELAPLFETPSAPVEAHVLALRAAQMAGRELVARDHATRLLGIARAVERTSVLQALDAWRAGGGRWAAGDALNHARLLLAAGRSADAAGLLAEAAARGDLPGDGAAHWLRLAFEQGRNGDTAAARHLFEALSRAFPGSPEAAKAEAQLAA